MPFVACKLQPLLASLHVAQTIDIPPFASVRVRSSPASRRCGALAPHIALYIAARAAGKAFHHSLLQVLDLLRRAGHPPTSPPDISLSSIITPHSSLSRNPHLCCIVSLDTNTIHHLPRPTETPLTCKQKAQSKSSVHVKRTTLPVTRAQIIEALTRRTKTYRDQFGKAWTSGTPK